MEKQKIRIIPVRDGLGIGRFRRLSSFVCPPHFRPRNRFKTAIIQTAKTELKTQKNRLFRRFFCKIWSECGDSNPGPPAPKASALPTALHPVMKFSNCGQTCGQRRFLTSCRRGGKYCQPNCPKAFRGFRERRLEPGPHAPKSSALPTALYPDI